MTRAFEEGDVVILKSGGPLMTVLQYDEDGDDPDLEYVPGVSCVWFGGGDTAEDVQMHSFDEGVLRKYVPKDEVAK